jgi:xanthine dehydrogenase accessory factor
MSWSPLEPGDVVPGPEAPGSTRDADVWDAFARWRAERRRFAFITVVESRGFTPRKPGAHMLVRDDGVMVGTIGGGAIENEAIGQARTLLEGGGTVVLHRHLTQELGMCCGGEMTLFLEVIAPTPRLVVFGAGYIAKPLAAVAAGCGFDVTVVDGRSEWASEARFPTSRVVQRAPEDFAAELETLPGDYLVVVTHDHALDQQIVASLLGRPHRFIGMIGSVAKQRKFALRLRARGFSDEAIGRLHTPLGLDIGASTPEEIAVSVVAQLVAVRRGFEPRPAWTPPAPRAARAGAAGGAKTEAARSSPEVR